MKNADIAGPNEQGAAKKTAVPVRPRKTLQTRIQELIDQQAQLTAQRRALAAQQRLEARGRTAQIDSLIGAACRADKSTHAAVKIALDKHVLDPKLRALLKSEGWSL